MAKGLYLLPIIFNGELFTMSKIILASKSPRRISLLQTLGLKIIPVDSHADESTVCADSPKETARRLSVLKAETVLNQYDGADDGDIIIAADTLVELDGKALGKPKSRDHAVEMLSALSGRVHYVHTGVCIIKKGSGEISFAESSEVEFIPLSENDIEKYVSTGEPMDKAGAYGIQEKGGLFVKRIGGDYFNIMGLPLCRISTELKSNFGFSLMDLI